MVVRTQHIPRAIRVLATAPTVAALEALVNRFWCSENYRIDVSTLTITNVAGHIVPPQARIQERRGTYQFVMVKVKS